MTRLHARRLPLARASPLVRLVALLVVVIGVLFTASTLPGVRDDHPGFWVPVDGWLQGTGYALMALLVLLRPLRIRRARVLWWLIAVALTLRCLGYLVYFAWVRTLVPAPYPSVSDGLWVGASLLFIVAIALRARYLRRGQPTLVVLDGVIAGLTVAGIAVALLRVTLLTLTGPGLPERAVTFNVLYPVLDVVTLLLIAGLLGAGWRPDRAERLIALGIAVFAVVEATYLYQLAAGTFRPGGLLQALSYLSTAVVALAAWVRVAPPGGDGEPVAARSSRAQVLVPIGLAVFALGGLVVMVYDDGLSPVAAVLLVAALAVTIVRGLLTLERDREQADVEIASRTREITRFQSLVEASGDFVLISTLGGEVTFVNPAGRRMIGLDPGRDVATTSVDDYLTAEGRRHLEEVERPSVRKHGHWEGQSTLRDLRGGPPIPVTVASFMLRDPQSRAPFALATVQRDVSALLAAEQTMASLAEQRRLLLDRLVQAQEDERARIAADVHDDSVQTLAAVDLRLSLVRNQLAEAGADPAALSSIERAHAAVNDATARLRHLLFDLESPALRADLPTALREAAAFVLEDSGVGWSVVGDTDLVLAPAERVTAYRVAKEALVNARKHARASSVEIRLACHEGGLLMTVADDGCGLGADARVDRPGHLGLAGMRDRAAVAGGRVEVVPGPERGTEVRLWIPRGAGDDDPGGG